MDKRVRYAIYIILLIALQFLSFSCSNDDHGLKDEIESIKMRLNQYQTLLEAVSQKLTIVSVESVGNIHLITFSDGSTMTIRDGVDGVDGIDGVDGVNGVDGADGIDGKDAPYITDIVDGGNAVKFYFSDGSAIEVPKYSENPQRLIACWGDSFTAGAGKKELRYMDNILNVFSTMGYTVGDDWLSCSYPQYLVKLLGDEFKSVELAVGGESNYTIAARMGVNPALIGSDFVLPADCSSVCISDCDYWFDSPWGGKVKPLLQGSGLSVNPCYIDGVECTLKWTGKTHDDPDGKYTIARRTPGNRAITIPKGTPIIMYGAKAYRDANISVIWAYQNGGYTSNTALAQQLRKMVQSLPNNNYVIVGVHTGTYESRHEQECVLEAEFGARFLNLRRYFSTNALYDFGIEPDAADIKKMDVGSCPPAFLYDSVHLTSAGYAIVAYKLMERFRELGFL